MNGGFQRVASPLDRDLAVTHRLQQGALGPRGRPVDLVGQDHVGEDRPRLEDELAGRGVVDARAQDVRRQQIGGELDPVELAGDARRQCPRQQRLADAGHVLDQEVALGQQGDNREPDDLGLAQDDRLDVPDQAVKQGAWLIKSVVVRRGRRGGTHALTFIGAHRGDNRAIRS